MANPSIIKAFVDAATSLKSINLEVALKRNLGEISLFDQFAKRINAAIERFPTIEEAAPDVSDGALQGINNSLTGLRDNLKNLAATVPEQFVPGRQGYANTISSLLDQFNGLLVPFIVFSQEKAIRKSLSGSGDENVATAKALLEKTANELLENVRQQTQAILAEAQSKAASIQTTARDAASGVALIRSQEMFRDLLGHFKAGMRWSGIGAALGFSIFILFAIYLFYAPPEASDTAGAIYHTAVRLTLLGAFGAIVAFATKIFRSNLNMYYHTLHRQQLTSTIETFVAAARTDEYRDILLGKLVEAVSSFSSSGLIGGGEDMPNTAKLVIDALPKAILGK